MRTWMTIFSSLTMGVVAAGLVSHCSNTETTSTSANQPASTVTTNLTADSYRQIERLARPGINEALVISHPLLNAFNSVPPTVDLTPAASSVVAEASAVLRVIYSAACFLGSSAPAGVSCPANGGAVFNGGTPTGGVTDAVTTAANSYVGKIAEGFLPDVLRIDTTQPSGYASATCNAAGKGLMLCGGRKVADDVIDITLSYLFGITLSDNVSYTGAVGNHAQGHLPLPSGFPYLAQPL